MSQDKNTMKLTKSPHLNYEERKIIERMRKNGASKIKIADALERDLSTIKRELKRGSVIQRDCELRERMNYFADVGQRVYNQSRHKCGAKNKVIKCAEMVRFVEEKIHSPAKWSPDAAIGYAVANNLFSATFTTKTFYNWIDDGIVKVSKFDLHLKLRRKLQKKRKERKRILGKSIDERPKSIEAREDFGHWEGDGIVGAGRKGHIITLIERKLGIGMMFNVGDRNDERIIEVFRGLKEKYGSKFSEIFKTATFDNGSEFARSDKMEQMGTLKVFYAHPYSSWERGTNENWNGIVRRFIPKGMDFSGLTGDDMQRISHYINTLPRKRFNYRTPLDLWNEQMYNLNAS